MNVLVTGASRGIGRAVALAFGKEGHRVLVHCRAAKAEAESAAEEIRRSGGEADVFAADVRRRDEAQDLVRRAVERWGSLDVLVNNAGIARDRTILKMTEDEWRDVLDVNLTGAFWCLQAASAEMVRQKDGVILNVASHAARRVTVGNSNYIASKAGLVALTRAAALELGRFNVRVNAVLPGFHPTEIGRAVWEKHRDKILGEHVLGRLTDLDEFAAFLVNLSRQKSVSGQVFPFESRLA